MQNHAFQTRALKEKALILTLSCIILMMAVGNAQNGPQGRTYGSDSTGEATVLREEQFLSVTGENGRLILRPLRDAKSMEEEIQIDEERLRLYSLAACMMDADSGRILFGKNPYEKRAMASTTKILTCLLALENCSMDDIVTVSEYAASMPDVQLNMQPNEQFRLYDLLLSLMLESHNDTAVAIAEHVGGTVEDFCGMMTERAMLLGCENSVFLTPNGLDKELSTEEGSIKHSTTAEELSLIMRECLKNEVFVAIAQTKNAVITNCEKSRTYSLQNHNALFQMMDGVIAGKTGFTGDAGYCYVGAVTRKEGSFICALLGCGWPNNKSYKWADMKTLIAFAETHYQRVALDETLLREEWRKPVLVRDAVVNNKPVSTIIPELNKGEQTHCLLREGEIVSILYELPHSTAAPIAKGTELGSITYQISGQTIRKDRLTAVETVNTMKLTDYLSVVADWFLLKVGRNAYSASSADSSADSSMESSMESEKCSS